MKELIDRGHAAAEAAEAAVAARARHDARRRRCGRLAEAREELLAALLDFDAELAHERLDALLGSHTADVVLRDIVIPVLHEIGRGVAARERLASPRSTSRPS